MHDVWINMQYNKYIMNRVAMVREKSGNFVASQEIL